MENLKIMRAKLGASQSVVAKSLGISQQAYANYENGNRQPDNIMLNSLANYFNVSTDYLLGRDDEPQKNTHLSEADRRVLELFKEYPIMYKLVEAIRGMDAERQQDLIDFAQLHAYKYGQKEQK